MMFRPVWRAQTSTMFLHTDRWRLLLPRSLEEPGGTWRNPEEPRGAQRSPEESVFWSNHCAPTLGVKAQRLADVCHGFINLSSVSFVMKHLTSGVLPPPAGRQLCCIDYRLWSLWTYSCFYTSSSPSVGVRDFFFYQMKPTKGLYTRGVNDSPNFKTYGSQWGRSHRQQSKRKTLISWLQCGNVCRWRSESWSCEPSEYCCSFKVKNCFLTSMFHLRRSVFTWPDLVVLDTKINKTYWLEREIIIRNRRK